MKNLFGSVNGTVLLSALALLSFIGYAVMEMRYFLAKWIPGDGAAMVETIVILLIVGGWLRALFVANAGRRGGLIAMFAFSVFTTVIALYDLQFVLNPQSPLPYPELVMWAAMLIVSVIAAGAAGMYLRGGKKTT